MVTVYEGKDFQLVDALVPSTYQNYASLYSGGIGLMTGSERVVIPVTCFKAMLEVAQANLGFWESGKGGLMEIARDIKGLWTEQTLIVINMINVFSAAFPEEKPDERMLREEVMNSLQSMVVSLEENNPYLSREEVVELGDLGLCRRFDHECPGVYSLRRAEECWIWAVKGQRELRLTDLEVFTACTAVVNFESAWIAAFGSQIVRNGILSRNN